MMVPVPHTDSKPFSLQLSQSFHLLWYFGGCESLVKLASNGVRGWHKSSFLILSFLTFFPYFLLLESKGDQRQKTKRVKTLPNLTSINSSLEPKKIEQHLSALDFAYRVILSERTRFSTLSLSWKIKYFVEQNIFYRLGILHDFLISSYYN